MSELSISTNKRPGGVGEVFLISYPTVVTMLSHGLLGAADAMMVGRVGVSELAAVGLMGTVYFTLMSLYIDTVAIVNTYVSQAFGGGRRRECARRAWQGVYLGLFAGPIVAGYSFFLDDLLALLGPSQNVQALAFEYGSVRLWGSGLLLVYIAVSNFFRGVGMVKTPMVTSLFINGLNVFLDWVMIYGKLGCPAMGVAGAAWASNVSLLAGVALIFAVYLSSTIDERFATRSTRRPDFELMGRMVKVGLPAGTQWFIDMTAVTAFTAFIGRMGDSALAASEIAFHVMAVSFNSVWGVSVATSTLVGQYIGAGRKKSAEKSALSAVRMVLGFQFLFVMVLALFPEAVTGIFTDDGEVIAMGSSLLYMAVFLLVFDCMSMIAVGALRGAGDTRFPMVVSLVGAWGVFLPLSYFLGGVLGWGVMGAWLGCAMYFIGLSALYVGRFRSGRWKEIEI